MGNCFLLQEIFPTQGLNPGLAHCRQILYRLSHQGNQSQLLEADFSHMVKGTPKAALAGENVPKRQHMPVRPDDWSQSERFLGREKWGEM